MGYRRSARNVGAFVFLIISLVAFSQSIGQRATAEDVQSQAAPVYDRTVGAAITYLRTTGQSEDGSYSSAAGPGVTAIITTAVLRHGRTANDPLVARSLAYLKGFVRPDGGIHQKDSLYKNYETCLAIVCFSQANGDGRYDKILSRAEAFVKGLQWDGEEGHDESSFSYGGAGYGKHRRPDLSNTSFLIEALRATGNGPDDEAMQQALVFVSRSQNLESDQNTTPFGAKVDDGGFYYTPAAGGSSQAGTEPGGGLRSYGSMTYAGLKSMIFAGVGPDDPRVKAAYDWARNHYDLRTNPGMGNAGLFYYYHTFAKALSAVGKDTIEDSDGVKHDWRAELTEELARRQRPDGSFVNENPRWLEGDRNLVTGYALLTLSYCKPKKQK